MKSIKQENEIISVLDFERIMQCLETAGKEAGEIDNLKKLKEKIQKAQKVQAPQMPPDVITIGSVVEIKTDDDNFTFKLELVYPEFENVRENKISVFSNLGTAIFLRKCSDVITYSAWGREHRIKVLSIHYQPEAVGDFNT
ncbi:GreA/GreB family elongation factor [Maribellus sp. YY47]|uniref:GreA/GreB family elongation factor n=1 Tax=Maribellus sp. YY47 TaxID=2929486 RepID=UPI0020006CD1|nr:GreA/GreB family elongation factor [Maribellus sp. YY47]MCK3685109.1 GreA/GreB family elongation factor [Maribellus sp. YY47]